MEKVTGEQVRDAMIAAGIYVVPHHDCGGCGKWVSYQRDGDRLYFAPGCGCSWSPMEPRSWADAADWINMQTEQRWRDEIARKFGLAVQTDAPL